MSPAFYLLFVIMAVVILFVFAKRPMYEAVFMSFLFFTVVSGNLGNIGSYFLLTAKNYLLYAIIGFVAFSAILNKTGIIDDFLNIIVALVGRFPGGAGYVTVCMCSIMGALSGSAPGNAASIGSITVPAMRRTGFSPELAATVGTACSSMGMIIPPSGAIATSFGILVGLYPDCCTLSQFWLMMWGITLWLILQRVILLYIFVKKNKIAPISREERAHLGQALKKGWRALLLPLIVFLPFLLDSMLSATLFTARLGADGAKTLSGCLLVLVPSISAAYCVLISDKRVISSPSELCTLFADIIHQVSPIAVLIFAGFAFGYLFADIGVGQALQALVAGAKISRWLVIIVLPLIMAVLGMFMEPLTIMLMTEEAILILAASVGINPILMAGMHLAMGHVMANMTPPFASTFFVYLGLTDADFVKSTKLISIWCLAQYAVIVLILAGVIPVAGLIPFTA